MSPKKPAQSFTSFRIIGEKAQKLFARAKTFKKQDPGEVPPPLPESEHYSEIMMHISTESVVKATFAILAIAGGVMLLYMLQDKIVVLLLAIFLAAVIDPGVSALTRRGVPRGIAILLHYVVAIFAFLFLLISLIPIIATQLGEIAFIISAKVNAFIADPTISLPLVSGDVNAQLSEFARQTLDSLSIENFANALERFSAGITNAAQGSLKFAKDVTLVILNFIVHFILILVLAFFIQIEKEKIFRWIRSFLPRRYRAYMDNKSELIHFKLGQWARGQLLLGLCIGLLVFLALVILRMPYALTLALLAGFTEFIPVIGPLIAAVPAVLIAFTEHGWVWGIVVTLVYYVIQWCENNLLVPLIMKRAVGLSPIAIIFAMLVAISFPTLIHPVLGIMLSIPVTTIIALFLEDWRYVRSQKEKTS